MRKTSLDWLCKLALSAGVLAVPGIVWAKGETRNLVIHLYDFARVPDRQWTLAKEEADQVYGQIGVRIVWISGPSESDAPASALHVNVLITSQASAERQTGNNAPTLGVSDKSNKTAYIFYSRIADLAGYSLVATGSLLGKIIAHEVGHLLLSDGHSRTGIMRAFLDPAPHGLERFDDAQAEAIRAKIDSANQ